MSATSLEANRIRVVVRDGWEVEFSELDRAPGARRRSLVHMANFVLPVDRGDYGSGAVERMDAGAILVILMEFDAGSAAAALFAASDGPGRFSPGDFSPQSLQRRLAGQSGTQRFFRVADRAFGLYVVLGSSRSAPLLVPEVNRAVAGITIE